MNGSLRNELGRHTKVPSFMPRAGTSQMRLAPAAIVLAAYSLMTPGFGLLPSLVAKEKPPTTYTIPLPPQPDFSSLDWMVGEWSGATTDHEPPGKIWLSVAYDLDKRVMIFREQISLRATETIPAVSERWMGILSTGRTDSEFILRMFSSTGFITRYRVSVDGAEIEFTPAGGEQPPPGWLFRRVVVRTNADELTETVRAAPPQKAFFNYYAAKLMRAKPAASKPE